MYLHTTNLDELRTYTYDIALMAFLYWDLNGRSWARLCSVEARKARSRMEVGIHYFPLPGHMRRFFLFFFFPFFFRFFLIRACWSIMGCEFF